MRRTTLIVLAAAFLAGHTHAQIAPAPNRRPQPLPKTPVEDPPKKEDFKPAPIPSQPDPSLQICKPFGDVMWSKDKPDLGDKSSESCLLREDPKTKAADMLLRLPPGFELPPHWHSANVTHTVISGTYEMSGEGPSATKVEMPPGTFNYTPAGMVHEGRVKGSEPVVMLVTFDGPRDTKLLSKDGPPPRAIGGQPVPRFTISWTKPADLKWKPFGQGVPAEVALVHATPDGTAVFLLIRVKGAMYVPRHWHPTDASVCILSGSYTIPCAAGKSKTVLPKGSYAFRPAKLLQNGWVGNEGMTMLVCSRGPFWTEWVEIPTTPSDPQEKKE